MFLMDLWSDLTRVQHFNLHVKLLLNRFFILFDENVMINPPFFSSNTTNETTKC